MTRRRVRALGCAALLTCGLVPLTAAGHTSEPADVRAGLKFSARTPRSGSCRCPRVGCAGWRTCTSAAPG